ncbi:hypothetical protein CJ030_MR3G005799 [Morella rubra]|uniref:Retrotransposon gag domain-containing protein n=1 Tax=Morella rubra TaxID=262757 RepID=A0A6A1WAE5_9ROSI|nr:hypothetical protein CJ030_MR3G005799 [Morella rubra]
MHMQSYLDAILCRAFSLTLKGPAHKWFFSLPLASISTFEQLGSLFTRHFVSNKRIRRPLSYLFGIKQESKENLRNYIVRFNQEAVIMAHAVDEIKVMTLINGLQPGDLLKYLIRKTPIALDKYLIKPKSIWIMRICLAHEWHWLLGSDPIGFDRSFEFRCRTATID